MDSGTRETTLTDKTVAEKTRLIPGTTIAVVNRVPHVMESLGLPAGVVFVDDPSEAQLVFLFVNTRAELEGSHATSGRCSRPEGRDLGLLPQGFRCRWARHESR